MFRFRPLAAFAIAPVALLILSACGGGSDNKPKTEATTAPQPTATRAAVAQATTPAGGGASSSELTAAADALSKVKSFRAKITIEAPNLPKQDGSLEVILPDKYHVTITGVEIIAIGNDNYLKIGTTWIKQTGASASPFKLSDVTSGITALAGTTGLTKGGTDTVDGKRCQIYSQTSAGTEYCIGSDNLILRIVQQAGGSKTTIVFTDYNANFEIKAPI
jgi:hypothetical protein